MHSFLILCLLLALLIAAQSPCKLDLSCPNTKQTCYLTTHPTTPFQCYENYQYGCSTSALVDGVGYFPGNRTAGLGELCMRCPSLSPDPVYESLRVQFYHKYGVYALVTGTGFGNCQSGLYCGPNGTCLVQKQEPRRCTSTEECQSGLGCFFNTESNYATCSRVVNYRINFSYRAPRVIGIGVASGMLLVAITLFCAVKPSLLTRTVFSITCVLVVGALAMLAYAVYWAVAPWPFAP